MIELSNLPTETLQLWLSNHQTCLEAGMRIGEIDRHKAQRISLEIIRRSR